MTSDIKTEKIRKLQDRLKKDPNDLTSWKSLGVLYLNDGDLLPAQNSFQKVLSIDPDDIEAQVYLDRIIERKKFGQHKFARYVTDFRSRIDHEIPLWLQLVISLISFAFIFLIAFINQWEAADMVWSLWITSFTIGYCYLLAGITSNSILKGFNFQDSIFSKFMQPTISLPINILFLVIGSFFQIFFFSLHFGLFHFVHSIFLNDFFPIIDRSFENPLDFLSFVAISVKLYWPVILFTFFSTLRKFQRIFLQEEKDYIKQPYINVIKIHLSIFLFAGINAIGLQGWILLLVFVIYFFPFSATFEYIKNQKKTESRELERE